MLTIGLLLLLFSLCIAYFVFDRKILTPGFIFNAIWFITISLYELKLSYIQNDLSDRTLLVFFVCVIVFNLVYILCRVFGPKFKMKHKKKNKTLLRHKWSIDKKIKVAKYIVLAVFILEVITSGGVPLVWKFIGDSRSYANFGISSLNGAFCGLLVCLGAYTIFSKSKDKYIYLTIGILMLSRQVLLSMAIEAIIFTICQGSVKNNLKKIAVAIVVIVAGFTVLGNFRSGSQVMDNVFQAKPEYESLPSSVKWVYSYMTFSISNFDNLTYLSDGGVNHGASIADELLPTVVTKNVDIKPEFKRNYLVSRNYTVSTFLPSLYLDFGVVGVGVFMALIAFLGYILERIVRAKRDDKNSMFYSVYLHNLLMLFFVNMFFYLPIMIQFVYIPILFSRKKQINNVSEAKSEKS